MNKLVFNIGNIVYLILAVLALLFYLERTAFLDISFHLFYILKDGDFAIQNNRFGAAMTQIFPLIGSKIGLSLESIMKLYSIGFVIYYYAIFFICSKVLKSYKFGLVMILFSTLMVTDTFYWIQSELPQGLAFMILYFAILHACPSNQVDKQKKRILYFAIPAMIIVLVFFHPLLIFPFLFCSIFLYLDNSDLRAYLRNGLLVYCLFFVIKYIFFKTEYDSTAMRGAKNFVHFFPDYISMESNKEFLFDLVQKYYLLAIVFLGMMVYYFKDRKYIKAFLMSTFSIGYTLLVNVSYPNKSEQFYSENLYLPLSVFIIIPFVMDFSIPRKKLYLSLIALMAGIRLMHIGLNHEAYTNRVSYLKDYLKNTKSITQKKLITSERHFPKDTLFMTWASPYEFWLLSTITEDQTRSIVITSDFNEVEWAKSFNKKFVTEWGVFNYSDLPSKYFILNDTTSYRVEY